MLILAHADGSRVDFYQLRQRILQSSGNGYGGTKGDIELGEFFCSQFGGRINGCARFGNHHIGDRFFHFPKHFGDELFAFPGGRAVSDGNDGDAVFADQGLQGAFGTDRVVVGHSGVDYRRI